MLTRLVSLMVALTWTSPVEEGFRPLFDGKSLAGWFPVVGNPADWGVEGGSLVARGSGKGWISTDRPFADHVLRLEYRTGPAGNSGVLIRAPLRGDPSFDGMEIQILDDGSPAYRGLRPDQYTGSVYGVVAARRGRARPPGEWNFLEIRAEGPKVRVELNGEVIVDEADVSGRTGALASHPGIRRRSGYIGLQLHETPVQFRNIRVKELH